MEKTTTISFTAEELQIVKDALNNYAVEMMEKSKTWGVCWAGEDIYHVIASKTNRIWCRCYDAKLELMDEENVEVEQ